MKKNGEFVGVDEKFIPDEDKYVDDSIIGNRDKAIKTGKKIFGVIAIGYLVFFALIFLGIFLGIFFTIKSSI